MPHHSIDIHHVARLARLKLDAEEAAVYGEQLGHVLDYIAVLGRHDLDAAMPAAHAESVFDVWREDVARTSFTSQEALANAPRKNLGQFQMPRVVED